MNFLCSKCGKKFRFDDLSIESPGLWIGCSNCGKGFFVEKKQYEAVSDSGNKGSTGSEHSEFRVNENRPNLEGANEGLKLSAGSVHAEKRAVGIGETRKGTDDVNFDKNHIGAGSKVEVGDFNWGKFVIGKEGEYENYKSPELFEEDSGEILDKSKKDNLETPKIMSTEPQQLIVDKEILARSTYVPSHPAQYRSKASGTRRKRSGAFDIKRIFYSIFTIIILVIGFGVFLFLIERLEFMPKAGMYKLSSLIKSTLPFSFFEPSTKEIVVSDSLGRWSSTRNGYIYVVSGHIANKSNNKVSHIKIRVDFIRAGEKIHDQVGYIGNSLTENEIRTMPIEDLLLKLQRKTGDIDFYNPTKRAGHNVDIEPEDLIPFYSVFPTKDKILGLKYSVEVIDFDKLESN